MTHNDTEHDATAAQSDRQPITRRAFLKTTGVTAGATAVGTSATPPALAPVQRAEAIGVTGALLAGVAVGAVAGVTVTAFTVGTETSVDPEKIIDDQVYLAVEAVATGREDFQSEMTAQFIKRPDETTPFANSAWQNVRATAVKNIENGAPESEAIATASSAVDETFTRSVTNIISRWNTGIDALIQPLYTSYQEGNKLFSAGPDVEDETGQYTGVSPFDFAGYSPADVEFKQTKFWGTFSGVGPEVQTPIDNSPGDGTSLVYEIEMSKYIPVPADTLEGRDEPLSMYVLPSFGVYEGSSQVTPRYAQRNWYCPVSGTTGHYENCGNVSEQSVLDTVETYSSLYPLSYEHPDLGTATALDPQLYFDVLSSITTSYKTIKSDLSTYVGELYASLGSGTIDPATVLTTQDILEKFGSSADQSRLSAELLATGVAVPTDHWGAQVKLNHSDLPSETWGQLYISFVDELGKEARTISPETTVLSEHYDAAYLAVIGDNGSTATHILSGTSDLAIIDVVDENEEQTSITYDQPVEHVADPTTVDSEKLKTQLNYQSEQIEKLEKALDTGGVGGIGGIGLGGGLPSPGVVPGVSGLAEWVVLVIGGSLGVSFLTSAGG